MYTGLCNHSWKFCQQVHDYHNNFSYWQQAFWGQATKYQHKKKSWKLLVYHAWHLDYKQYNYKALLALIAKKNWYFLYIWKSNMIFQLPFAW